MPRPSHKPERTAKTLTATGEEHVEATRSKCAYPKRYDLEGFVASGGMGDVWLYHDRTLGRNVAIKELKPTHAGVQRRKLRFIREAQVQAALQHPGIVPIYDFAACDSGGVYFTMRHVEGQTLAEVVQKRVRGEETYSQRQLLAALDSVSLTLQYAHERGVVHRDLKPENVILGDYGEVYVLDWGVAKVFDPGSERHSAVQISAKVQSHSDRVVGTLEYMAPEQLAGGESVGPGVDVFALGILLFEVLTGELLREGDEKNVVEQVAKGDDLPERLSAAGDVPAPLAELCIAATSRYFRDRPTAREFHEQLLAYLEGETNAERFRTAAGEHVQSARARLSISPPGSTGDEQHHAAAVAELGRALALDPTRTDALETLRALLAGKSQELPNGAQEELDHQRDEAARESARASIFVYAAWLALIPLALIMGVRSLPALAFLVSGPALLVAVNLWVDRKGHFSAPLTWIALVLSFTSVSALSVFAGPYLLVPSLAVATAVTYLIAFRGNQPVQIATQVLAPLAVVVPIALQAAGLVPRSYVFEDGHVVIKPFAVDLPPAMTEVLFLVGGTLLVVLANYIVTRVVTTLDRAEKRTLGQAWWLRQLLPGEATTHSQDSSATPALKPKRVVSFNRKQ